MAYWFSATRLQAAVFLSIQSWRAVGALVTDRPSAQIVAENKELEKQLAGLQTSGTSLGNQARAVASPKVRGPTRTAAVFRILVSRNNNNASKFGRVSTHRRSSIPRYSIPQGSSKQSESLEQVKRPVPQSPVGSVASFQTASGGRMAPRQGRKGRT